MKTAATPRVSVSWNGYSKRGQAQYDAIFEHEKAMADKYDPVADSEPGDMYYGI